jgi:hypothetical protein
MAVMSELSKVVPTYSDFMKTIEKKLGHGTCAFEADVGIQVSSFFLPSTMR